MPFWPLRTSRSMIGSLSPSPPPRFRSSRFGLFVGALAIVAIFAGILLRTGAGPVLFAAGAVGLPLGLLAAGIPARSPRRWWLSWALAALAAGSAAAGIAAPGGVSRQLVGGWPFGSLLALAGLWLLPLLLLGVGALALSPSEPEAERDAARDGGKEPDAGP